MVEVMSEPELVQIEMTLEESWDMKETERVQTMLKCLSDAEVEVMVEVVRNIL